MYDEKGENKIMKYLICERQIGVGCDSTIGCGMRFYWMDAESVEAAQEEIIWPEGRDDYPSIEGYQELIEILIIPAEFVNTVDITPEKEEWNRQVTRKEMNATEEIEKKELNRLQRKYCGTGIDE